MLWLIASYILSISYKCIYFSLPLSLVQYTEWIMHQIFSVLDVKNNKSLNPILYFIASFTKLLWDFLSELLSLKYDFNIPFKITLKTIRMGTFFQFHEGAQLNILPKPSSDILLLNWTRRKEAFVKSLSYLLNNNGNLNKKFNWFAYN